MTATRAPASPKASAEAHHNSYRAALERQQWTDALAAFRQAVTLDPVRFSPFPFKRYEPQRILGAGGFGVVFLCQDRLLARPVVVKALLPSELDRSIAAHRERVSSAGEERHADERLRMLAEYLDLLAARHVPYSHRGIAAAG